MRLPYAYRSFEEAHRLQAEAVNLALNAATSSHPRISPAFPGVEQSQIALADAVNSLLTGERVRLPKRMASFEGYRRLAGVINTL